MHSNPNLIPWREAVAWAAKQAIPHQADSMLAGAIELCVTFRVARPKSVKRAMPTVPPDVDKLARSIGDALSGIIFNDDAQIVHLDAWKAYASTPSMSGCDIRVSEIE